jgi:hypothetical protein
MMLSASKSTWQPLPIYAGAPKENRVQTKC